VKDLKHKSVIKKKRGRGTPKKVIKKTTTRHNTEGAFLWLEQDTKKERK
jgi:hypothetical protein